MTIALKAAKIDRGVKRRCGECNTAFYDLLRYPIRCPKCGAAVSADSRKNSAGNPAKRFKASVSRTPSRSTPELKAKRTLPKRDEEEASENAGEDLILDAEDAD